MSVVLEVLFTLVFLVACAVFAVACVRLWRDR